MEMAARGGEKTYESLSAVPAVKSVEGAPLSGVEFFGAGDSGMLLQFGGARLEIMSGTRVEAATGTQPLDAASLRDALEAAAGSRVAHVGVEPGRVMTLAFATGLTLSVSLDHHDRPGLESAAYYDAAWRYEAY